MVMMLVLDKIDYMQSVRFFMKEMFDKRKAMEETMKRLQTREIL